MAPVGRIGALRVRALVATWFSLPASCNFEYIELNLLLLHLVVVHKYCLIISQYSLWWYSRYSQTQTLENMENDWKNPCMLKVMDFENEKSWKNHRILARFGFLDVSITQMFLAGFARSTIFKNHFLIFEQSSSKPSFLPLKVDHTFGLIRNPLAK